MPKFNTSEPLGLPRGSIRGLIAVMLTATFCYRFLVGAAIDPTLTAVLGIVLTFYFVKRGAETEGTEVEYVLPEPVA